MKGNASAINSRIIKVLRSYTDDNFVSVKQNKHIKRLPSSSENPTVSQLTRMVDERKGGTEEVLKTLTNGRRKEEADEYNRGVQTKHGKEHAVMMGEPQEPQDIAGRRRLWGR